MKIFGVEMEMKAYGTTTSNYPKKSSNEITLILFSICPL
jgi:hypothetical protein